MAAQTPRGLLVEMLADALATPIGVARPRFSWEVVDAAPDAVQGAYQVQVATSADALRDGRADAWDSGRVASERSVAVEFGGPPLAPARTWAWRVRTADAAGAWSGWSAIQRFATAARLAEHATPAARFAQREETAASVRRLADGRVVADFAVAAFGRARVRAVAAAPTRATIRLGEAAGDDGAVAARGPFVRVAELAIELSPGDARYEPMPPPHRSPYPTPGLAMPAEVGEVVPFRWCELAGWPGEPTRDDVRRVVVAAPHDPDAADFACDDERLVAVWRLCKHSIAATTFAGVYVDGDRERLPYEADAYINQLGHYAIDREFAFARRTHEWLLTHATWPTEWPLHSLLMAWADWMHTGDERSARAHWPDLRAKALEALARADGLISTRTGLVTPAVLAAVHAPRIEDNVDWPPVERDGFVFAPINAVVNAFHARALACAADLAAAIGETAQADDLRARARRVVDAFNAVFWDEAQRRYVDGEGVAHASLHANMVPLAFGLVPAPRRADVVAFLRSRGMACSVYGAQYLLEALYDGGAADAARALMTADGDRSWPHMLALGATITLEAWDARYKPNLDWNHAWGAAPANIIPRKLIGVEPLAPGFAVVRIRPRLGGLRWARMRMPTVRGTIAVACEERDGACVVRVDLPANVRAEVRLPAAADGGGRVAVDGVARTPRREDGELVVEVGSGQRVVERLRP